MEPDNNRSDERAFRAVLGHASVPDLPAGAMDRLMARIATEPQDAKVIAFAPRRPAMSGIWRLVAAVPLAASLALGAQGAWLGTLWLGTREHEMPQALAKKLIAADSEDTVITRAHSGKPCRVLRSAFSDAWAQPGAPEPLSMPYQQALTGDLLAAVEQHQIGPLMYEAAGQSVHWLRGIEPVAAVMDRLVTETRQALQSMASYIA